MTYSVEQFIFTHRLSGDIDIYKNCKLEVKRQRTVWNEDTVFSALQPRTLPTPG